MVGSMTEKTWEEFGIKVYDPELGLEVSLCGLCGNTGYIHTMGVFSPKKLSVPPMDKPCICPNGRYMKKKGI